MTLFILLSTISSLICGDMLDNQEGATQCNQTLTLENNQFSDKPQIHLFIHVCTINHWEYVLDRQLKRIKTSGLYDACDSISLGVLGDEDLTTFIYLYPKLTILFQDPNTAHYERPTLLQLHALCKSSPKNTLVLYLHTKGVSHRGSVPNPYIMDWSCYMEYFAVDRWRDCVVSLQDHDVCGVNWRTHPFPHFSGNFWWATAGYITTLPGTIGGGYYDPEFWIGLHSPKVMCFHESHTSHYGEPYPESKYIIRD